MCSLNKKCNLLFELLHRTVLAHSQANLLFEVHLLFFPSNTDEKLSVLTFCGSFGAFCIFIIKRFKSSSDNVANLDFNSAMTKLIKLLVSVLGDVTSTA